MWVGIHRRYLWSVEVVDVDRGVCLRAYWYGREKDGGCYLLYFVFVTGIDSFFDYRSIQILLLEMILVIS